MNNETNLVDKAQGKSKDNPKPNLKWFLGRYNDFAWFKIDDNEKQFFKTTFTIGGKNKKDKFYEFIRSYEHLDASYENKSKDEQDKARDEIAKKRYYAYENFVKWLNAKAPEQSWKNAYGVIDYDAALANQEGDYYDDLQSYEDIVDEADLVDYEGMEGSYTKRKFNIVRADYRNAILQMKYFNQARNDLRNAGPNANAIMRYVGDVLDITNEISIISAFGKINQGIDTNSRDAYAFVKRIDDYFNGKLALAKYQSKIMLPDPEGKYKAAHPSAITEVREINGEMVTLVEQKPNEYYSSYEEYKRAFMTSPLFADYRFNIYRFLDENPSNDKYREYMIKVCDTYKQLVNVADLMISIPHFKQMAKALLVARKVMELSSIKYNIENKMLSLLPNQSYTLKEDEYKRIKQLANGFLVYQFFQNYGQNMKMIYNKNTPVKKAYCNGELKALEMSNRKVEVEVKSVNQIATFKMFIERNIIPMLKEKYPDNLFIRSLCPTNKMNKKLKAVRTQFKLPINMANIDDSPELQYTFDELSKSFAEIANYNIPNLKIMNNDGNMVSMKLADVMFMYNLVVNQDGFGQASLTNMFAPYAENKSFFIRKYYDYLSDLDHNADKYETTHELDDKIQRIEDNMKRIVQMAFYDNADAESHFGITTKNEKGVDDVKVNVKFIDKYGDQIDDKIVIDISSRYNDFTLGMYEDIDFKTIISNKLAGDYNAQKQQETEEQLNKNGFQPSDLTARICSAMETAYKDNIVFNTNTEDGPGAYIQDGKIYINTNSSDFTWKTPIHEMAHLICAYLKFGDDNQRSIYNNWLQAITNMYFEMDPKSEGLKWKKQYEKD